MLYEPSKFFENIKSYGISSSNDSHCAVLSSETVRVKRGSTVSAKIHKSAKVPPTQFPEQVKSSYMHQSEDVHTPIMELLFSIIK